MGRLFLVWSLIVFVPAHATGQELSGPLAEMRSVLGQQIKGDEDVERLGSVLVRFGWELLRATTDSASERAAFDKVTFKYERSQGLTAARIQGGQIIISTGPLFELTTGAALLGHDIYVSSGREFPVLSMLAYGPLAKTAIIPLANPLAAWADQGVTYALCTSDNTACSLPQGTAMIVGTLAFTLAHEFAHLQLGHADGDQSLERELLADAAAARRINRLLEIWRREGGLSSQAHIATLAAPPLMLMLLKSRRVTRDWIDAEDSVVEAYECRRRRLLEAMAADDRAKVDRLLEPDVMDGRLASLVVTFGETPDVVYVNGLQMEPSALTRSRLVPAGSYVLFARKGSRLAYVRVRLAVGGEHSVAVKFREPQCPSAQRIEGLIRRRAWFDVLLASGGLSCAETSNGMLRYEALYHLGLGYYIPEAPADLPSDKEINIVARWRSESLPLGSWR